MIRKIKCIINILLVVIFCINSFASVLSENDGATFVTKYEFENLKKNFSQQIEDYNKSIDGKIDGAIANYLDGMQMNTKVSDFILITKPKEVGYYEDDNMVYEYATPAWDCAISGYQYDWGYGTTNPGSTPGSAKGLIIVTKYKPNDTDYGSSELTLKENVLGASQPWIWNGYYTNVFWSLKTDTVERYVPCDTNYGAIKGSYMDGPYFSLPPGNYTSTPYKENNHFRKCVLWSYNTNSSHRFNGEEWYGPYACSQSKKCMNSVSVKYKNDDRNVKYDGGQKWDRYIIGFKDSTKHCNVYDNVNYFGKGNDNNDGKNKTKKMSESYASFSVKQEIKEKQTSIVYTWGNSNKNIAWYIGTYTKSGMPSYSLANEGDAFHGVIDDKNNTYISVPGGLDGISSYKIRQEEDGIINHKIPSIELKDLSLLAGFPVCIEKKDTKIEWPISFVDKTKNYRVWLSYEPFDKNYSTYKGEPNTGLDLVDVTCDGVTGKNALIKNGEGTLIWTMAETKPVYMKWAITNGASPETYTLTNACLDLTNSKIYLKSN